jgi:hypothetical protein
MVQGESLIDTILAYCENHDIDEDIIAKTISKSLKEKILVEARDRNIMDSDDGVLDI